MFCTSIRSTLWICYVHLLLAVACIKACELERALFGDREVSLEQNVAASQIIFRSHAVPASLTPLFYDDEHHLFVAQFKLISTYKGVGTFSSWSVDNYRRINVTFVGNASKVCPGGLEILWEYIIFCDLVNSNELRAVSMLRWTESNDERIWEALGWGKWGDWTPCSESCSSGIQQRFRQCGSFPHCHGGHNIEQRHCNLFGCEVIADPLWSQDGRFYHPSKDNWQRSPNRVTAWRLRPNSYIWIPSSQIFSCPHCYKFPSEFAVFITLRALNTSMGAIFSLRSRHRQDTYLSLELDGSDLKLIHAAINGTDVVRIPANLNDHKWHYIAIGIRANTIVDSYVDCEWVHTDILRARALELPDDVDLVIGYLFTGDLEQLTVSSDPSTASMQCSLQRTPIFERRDQSPNINQSQVPFSPEVSHRNLKTIKPTEGILTDLGTTPKHASNVMRKPYRNYISLSNDEQANMHFNSDVLYKGHRVLQHKATGRTRNSIRRKNKETVHLYQRA